MTKPGLLMIGPMMPLVMDALDEACTVHRYWEADDGDALVAANAGGIRAIATNGHLGASRELIGALPNLEIIGCYGVGYDAIDVDAATEADVKVTNTPDVLNDDVADLGLALMLAVTRRIPLYDRYVRDGKWPADGEPPLTGTLRNRTLGIIGLGRIGKTVARRARAFDLAIAYHGRSEQPEQPFTYYADLTEMARNVNILLAICPGGPSTAGIVNASVLDALGPDGIFINIARGSVVDEPALVAALREGRIGGAGLDVFADEPRAPEALFAMDNVVLQPHMASATRHTRRAMGQLVIDNIANHFADKPLLTPVN